MVFLVALAISAHAAGLVPASAEAQDHAGPVVEYLVEIFEAPASGPPPEVAGPQGRRLFIGTLRAPVGAEVRQFIPVGGDDTTDPAKMRGISLVLSSRPGGGLLQTTMALDTNLPFGAYDQKKDVVWVHAQTAFSGASGATTYVAESSLAARATGYTQPPPAAAAPGTAGRVAGAVVDAGVDAAKARVPSAPQVPSAIGGLLKGGGGGSTSASTAPKPRPTMLLFCITPQLSGGAP